MSKKNQIHVVKNPNGGWFIKDLYTIKEPSCYETQQSAINRAIRQAKTQGNTEVIIHSKKGKIVKKSLKIRRNKKNAVKIMGKIDKIRTFLQKILIRKNN